MSTFLDRLIDERSELVSKISKLREFLLSDNLYTKLSQHNIDLLHVQFNIMSAYAEVLTQRIKLNS